MIFWILILSVFFRLVSINQSLWLDEATSALVSQMSFGDIYTRFLPSDFHPPLYYLILKLWTDIFGYSEFFLRIPSLIFGTLNVWIIYLIGKELFSKKTALIASLLLATSGLHVYYSQEARMYSLASLLVSLLIYFFIKNKWLFFSITLIGVGMVDYVSLFILPIFFIIGKKDIKKLTLSIIPTPLSYIIWFPIFIRQLSSGSAQEGSLWWNILGTPTLKNIFLIPVKFIIGRIGFDNKVLYGALVVCLFILFGYLLSKSIISSTKILWLWLLVPITIGVLVSFKIPTLSYFRFLFCLPPFYLLLSYGLSRLKPNHFKIMFLSVLLVNLVSTSLYLFNNKFHKEDWRGAIEMVGDSKLIFPARSQREVVKYYGKEDQIVEIEDLGKANSEIWLSRYVWELFDPSDLTRKRVEGLGYNKTSEYNFNGVILWRYQK